MDKRVEVCDVTTQETNIPADLFNDRVILVTGAGAGIGCAVAKSLAAHGATVILLGRTLAKLERVYDAIETAGGPKPAIYPMNLEGATPQDYTELARVLETEFGRLDGLLHNAGVVNGLTPLTHYDSARWQHTLQVNLTAPFLLTQATLGLLQQSTDASVVFTADPFAAKGQAYWGAYAVAKAGLQTLTKLLASELETNTAIRVNSIDPGRVRTALALQVYPGRDPAEWPKPDTILATYLYALGPQSRGVTGQVFSAQGVGAGV